MKKRKVGKNHGKLWKKRQKRKATQSPPSLNKREGRNAMKDLKVKQNV